MIGFVGLSHLGIVSSLAAAAKGFEIIAFDPNTALIRELNTGKFPVFEEGLTELLAEHKKRIHYTSNISDLKKCSVVYISRDVPTSEENVSDTRPVTEFFEKALANAADGTTIVILSQVPPGFVRKLTATTAKQREPRNISLFYQVETLIFGIAVERALKPERIIIGADNGKTLEGTYKQFLEAFGCPLLVMRYESAELAKISINICLISSVTVANVLSELCEKVGADWVEIEAALRLDRRIGQYAYIKPGLGIAGGNLERDLITLTEKLEENGGHTEVVKAWQHDLVYRSDWALRKLHDVLANHKMGSKIAILGLAYKPGTHSTKNSPALRLIEALNGFSLKLYDPLVKLNELQAGATQCETIAETVSGAEVVILMTAWPEFKDINIAALPSKIIIDPMRVLSASECKKHGVRHFAIGV